MKQNIPVENLIRKSVSVEAQPRLVAEFNHNRYSKPAADNTPSEQDWSLDPDIFPVESMVEPLRPGRGAVKATTEIADVAPEYSPQPQAIRYHIAEQEDQYKYWRSPEPAVFGGDSVQTINLAPYSSFEKVDPTLVEATLHRNLARDPRGYHQGSLSSTEVGWGTDRGWGTGGAGLYSYKIDQTDGPVGIGRYLRKTWTTGPSTTINMGFAHTIYSTTGTSTAGLAVSAGAWYTFYSYLRTNRTGKSARIKVVWRNAAGAVIGTEVVGPYVTLTADQWKRVSSGAIFSPAGTAKVQLVSDPDGGTAFVAGDTLDGGALMITNTDTYMEVPWYDGDGVGNEHWGNDFITSWTGSPQASSSKIQSRRTTGVTASTWAAGIASNEWSSSGSLSTRISGYYSMGGADYIFASPGGDAGGMRLGLEAGKTYTFKTKMWLPKPQTGSLGSAARRMLVLYRIGAGAEQSFWSTPAPNVAGEHEISMTCTIPAGATQAWVRFYTSAFFGNDTWWDDLQIIEGDYEGTYFNGDSWDDEYGSYAWSGEPHASTSIRAFNDFEFPEWVSGDYPTTANPQVVYENLVKTNKIVVGLENSVAKPTEYEVFVKNTLGGAWTKIGDQTNIVPDDEGRMQVWWNGTAWTQTRNISTYREIAGIQLRVTKMNYDRHLEVIELSARLEWDLTSYLQGVDDTFDLGDVNIMTPIGRISSNIARLRLFNGLVDEYDYTKGLVFNTENTDSLFFGLTKENVKFTLDYIFNASEHGGTSQEVVRQFIMYAEEDWGSEIEEGFTVNLRDASKFLQEMPAPETFYESNGELSVGEIIWMLLDSVGFTDYHIDESDVATPISTNFFWCDSTQKVWDVLSSLADGTQTAIYFDENGILQIKIKDIAFNPDDAPVWHVRGENSGLELADLEDFSPERKEVPNTVKVEYKLTDYQKTANNNYLNELVWEPDASDVVLRSSDLQEPFMIGDEYLRILPHQSQDWQYKGFVQIEGELIEYEGKEYSHLVSPSTTPTISIVTTHEQYLELLHKTDHEAQFRNTFTGRLKVKERGLWNTEEKDHTIQDYPYMVWQYENGGRKTTNGFIRQGTESYVADNERTMYDPQKSSVRLIATSSQEKDRTINVMTPGDSSGVPPRFMGTKFVIRESGQTNHTGGLCFSINPTTGAGYYVEVRPNTDATSPKKAVNLYIMHSDGEYECLTGAGVEAAIVFDKWYTLDVEYVSYTENHYIYIWLDGQMIKRVPVTGGDRRIETDQFGMFIRGSACFEYEYMYGYDHWDAPATAEQYWGDDISFYDRVKNGYVTNQSLNEFTGGTRTATRKVKKKTVEYQQRYNTRFFDEFVPVVHEMREFDIKFDNKMPGKRVQLLATNEATAKYLDFRGTPFGAHFYAINVSHDDVEIRGETEKLGILAQTIKQGEVKTKEFKDEESVRVSGKKELTFSSDWIQTEGQVDAIGEWITSHWGHDVDELSVTIHGNPLIQITDTVLLTEPQTERVAEKYYVLEASTDFSEGLQTTLRLRKVKS